MRVETLYFDTQGNRVSARDAVTGEVRQYDDHDRLVLTVHLACVQEANRRRWQQVRALGRADPARNAVSGQVGKSAMAVRPAPGSSSAPPAAPAAEQAG